MHPLYCIQSQFAHHAFWFPRYCWKKIGRKYLMRVARFKATMSWVHSKHLILLSNQVPLFLRSLIIVKFEVGMLIRYPTEEDLRMSLPQTPPAYMALLPSFSSFILHFFLRSLFSSLLSPIIDLQKPHSSPAFFSSFFSIWILPVSFPVHLSISSLLSASPSLFPCFPAPPSYQTSEPTINAISFWWGNKWNSSWEGGSKRWTKAFLWSWLQPAPSSLHQVPITCPHTHLCMDAGPSHMKGRCDPIALQNAVSREEMIERCRRCSLFP